MAVTAATVHRATPRRRPGCQQTAEAQAPVEVPAADAGEQPTPQLLMLLHLRLRQKQAPVAAEVQAPVVAEEAVVTAVAPAAEPAQPCRQSLRLPQSLSQQPWSLWLKPQLLPPQSQRPRHRATLPIAELQALAAASGLEWINSDAEKIAAVQAAIAAEPKPVRIPRERPPVVVLDEGPLILVETRKDLSLMQLPFEKEEQATGVNA
jgi:ribonuclease E